MDEDLEFLRALQTASAQGDGAPLADDQVNALGALLTLSEEDVLRLVERLRKGGLLEVYWGGKVALTPEGEKQATGQSTSGAEPSVMQVNVGAKANVAIGPYATAGAGATGAKAVRIAFSRGDLAAALQRLKVERQHLQPEAQAPVALLERELEDILQETRPPMPKKEGLPSRIAHAKDLLENLNAISKTGAGLFAPDGLIGIALHRLASWI